MKKLLTLAALMGVASVSFGQGYVGFANSSTTRISNGGVLQAAAPVNSYYYELLAAPVGTLSVPASLSGWSPVAVGANTATAGRMTGNNSTDGSATQINGYGPTATAAFAVVGWSANIGSTFADAVAFWNAGDVQHGTDANLVGSTGWFGISMVAPAIPLAPSGGPYNVVWGQSSAGYIQGMNLVNYAVPEPGTLALAGLGAAAMLIFRRRK